MRKLWLVVRHLLWKKLSWKLPAREGWELLVREVSSVDLWKDEQEGIFGLPLQWALLKREEGSRRIVPVDAVCFWSGEPISGSTPIIGDQQFDVSHWGVRCSRCQVPIHSRHAGMKMGNDVPSCPPCRRAVRRVIQEG